MSLFSRDPHNVLAERLTAIGVSATLPERGHPFEEYSLVVGSGHVIEISDSPIHAAYVWRISYSYDLADLTRTFVDYLIPDPQLSSRTVGDGWITPNYKRSFPLFGDVKAVVWEGSGPGSTAVNRLNSDESLIDILMKVAPETHIFTRHKLQCWALRTNWARNVPRRGIWDWYESIARRLLATS